MGKGIPQYIFIRGSEWSGGDDAGSSSEDKARVRICAQGEIMPEAKQETMPQVYRYHTGHGSMWAIL